MKEVIFAGTCGGIGISHVARDCDFAKTIGFYKNEYQIHYILDGERYFYSENKSCRMSKGTLSFIDKKKIPFTNVIGGKFHERVLIEIEESWLTSAGTVMELDFIRFFQNYHGVFSLDETRRNQMEQYLSEMEQTIQNNIPFACAEIKKILFSVFLMVLKGEGIKPEEPDHQKGKMIRYVKVSEIMSYIMEHSCEICGLEDLAAIFYLDKSYLSRIFKEVTNFTVNEFMNCQRIEQARRLLLNDSLSMEDISKKLGYERLSYFDRVFKKHTGTTPLQYRKSKKNPGNRSI
ncbi:helix-turn-helix domain-containing protein [Lacrimispora sp. JR3]|uniref:helix-turn-helix domain-containing protein n=1 Tax=Lacrimispora sinapis TaxID=3111456 RepID=UPI003747C1DA